MSQKDRVICECDTGQCSNATCWAINGAPCFRFDEVIFDEVEKRMVIESSFGCLGSSGHFQCKAVPHATLRDMQCCYGPNMCNLHLPVRITTAANQRGSTVFTESNEALSVSNTIVFAAVMLSAVVCCLAFARFFYQRRKTFRNCYKPAPDDTSLTIASAYSPDRQRHRTRRNDGRMSPPSNKTVLATESCYDQTNASNFYMGGRTIGHEVQLAKEIGRGRFGRVHLGFWRGEHVAVKIFTTADEHSFYRELDIYDTVFLRHENILGYFGADLKDMKDSIWMMLVTEYCSCGSLHKFLSNTSLTVEQGICLARTAAAGIDYLHNTLICTDNKSKPSIAHRDIKSNNILVKPNFVCVIADFGLAVKFQNGDLNAATNPREGTARYMPPELLSMLNSESKPSLDRMPFDFYKQGDIYSFALVMWEILNRCQIEGHVNEYRLPYQDMVNDDPKVSQMFDVVSVNNQRPPIAEAWLSDSRACQVLALICQCWATVAEARPPSRYVKKGLTSLGQHQGSNVAS